MPRRGRSAFDILPLFEPRAVALVGASEREGSLGTVTMRNLRDAGFRGRLHAVNPSHDSILGQPCVPGVRDIDGEVDLAVIVTPAATVPGVLEDCGASGVPAAVILSAVSCQLRLRLPGSRTRTRVP